MWSPKIHVTRSQSQLDLPRHIQKINRLTQSLTFTKPSYKFSNMYDNWLADMSDPRIIPGHSAIFFWPNAWYSLNLERWIYVLSYMFISKTTDFLLTFIQHANSLIITIKMNIHTPKNVKVHSQLCRRDFRTN